MPEKFRGGSEEQDRTISVEEVEESKLKTEGIITWDTRRNAVVELIRAYYELNGYGSPINNYDVQVKQEASALRAGPEELAKLVELFCDNNPRAGSVPMGDDRESRLRDNYASKSELVKRIMDSAEEANKEAGKRALKSLWSPLQEASSTPQTPEIGEAVARLSELIVGEWNK